MSTITKHVSFITICVFSALFVMPFSTQCKCPRESIWVWTTDVVQRIIMFILRCWFPIEIDTRCCCCCTHAFCGPFCSIQDSYGNAECMWIVRLDAFNAIIHVFTSILKTASGYFGIRWHGWHLSVECVRKFRVFFSEWMKIRAPSSIIFEFVRLMMSFLIGYEAGTAMNCYHTESFFVMQCFWADVLPVRPKQRRWARSLSEKFPCTAIYFTDNLAISRR